jgi:hypothetical protein
MKSKRESQPELLGGWLPLAWWGDKVPRKRGTPKKEITVVPCGAFGPIVVDAKRSAVIMPAETFVLLARAAIELGQRTK